jgi:hypothetical protein
MGTLGALMSQQLGFTVTTTSGTVYTHGLGFTPTVILLTLLGTATPAQAVVYTAAGATTITILASGTAIPNVDVLCGSLHSLIK